MRYPTIARSVLITGCSSGIGLATALRLQKAGWTVFPTARRTQDLDALRTHGFDPLLLDIGDEASVDQCVDALIERYGKTLGALVNNAGYGEPGAIEDLSRATFRRQFEVNVFGLQHLTNRLLPLFQAAGAGRVVHVSSVVGRVALPFMGAYSASKFAVEALADVQRVELAGTGIAVSLVEPGPIVTAFSQNAARSGAGVLSVNGSRFDSLYAKELSARQQAQRTRKPFALPPDAVARKIEHALRSPHPRRRYKVTLPAHLGAFLSRVAPDALIDALFQRELRQRLKAARKG